LPALILVPIIVGVVGIAIERVLLRHIYGLDHLYGLLLTFGLALIIEGVLPPAIRLLGQPLCDPAELQGGRNLGFMFLPNYRVLGHRRLARSVPWNLVPIERTSARRLSACATREPGPRSGLWHQRAADDHLDYGAGVALRRSRGSWQRRIYQVSPLMGSNIIITVFAVG